MTVRILFVDLRNENSIRKKADVQWNEALTASDAIGEAFTKHTANTIAAELDKNYEELTVSWSNSKSEQHSEIGGMGNLEWLVQDGSVIVIMYQDQDTTEEQVDESYGWMLENEL